MSSLSHLSLSLYIYIYIVSWLTVVAGYSKTPFYIATTLKCRRERYSFPCIVLLTLHPYFIMLSVKQGSYDFCVFGMIRPRIEPRCLRLLTTTLTIMPLGWYPYLNHFDKLHLAQRLECSPMARETWVQSQVESYQRH